MPDPDPSDNPESQPLLPPSAELMPASRSKLQARRYISPAATSGDTSSAPAGSSSPGSSPPASSNPPPMSDKARGKQRALDPHPDEHEGENGHGQEPGSERDQGCSVTVIFSNEESAGGNLDVWVEERESVASVKDKIRTLRPNVADNQLRLIHAGRLLTDGVLLVPWLRSLDERIRRQAGGVSSEVSDVLRDVGRELAGDEPNPQQPPSAPPPRVYLHCNVGGPLGAAPTPSEEAEPEPTPRRRGFDALLDAGLSAEEVAAMRRQFYESRGEEVPDIGVGVSDEHARALEEQWIEGGLTPETASLSTEGLYTSILYGLLAGFLYGFLPWFYIQDLPLPNFFDAEAEAEEVARRESMAAEAKERAAHALAMAGGGSRGAGAAGTGTGAEASGGAGGASGERPSDDLDSDAEEARELARLREAADSVSAAVSSSPAVGAEAVTGVVYDKRMRVGVIIGTLINIGIGALGSLFSA